MSLVLLFIIPSISAVSKLIAVRTTAGFPNTSPSARNEILALRALPYILIISNIQLLSVELWFLLYWRLQLPALRSRGIGLISQVYKAICIS